MDLLLVEDDVLTGRALDSLLRRLGFEVHHARDVSAALDELVRLPNVVILDLPLFDGTGLEILKMMKEVRFPCQVAVLMSPLSDTVFFRQIQAFNPSAIFQKPLNFEDFGIWLCDLFP